MANRNQDDTMYVEEKNIAALRAEVEHLRNQLDAQIASVKGTVDAHALTAQAYANEAKEKIREKPFFAVAAALGAGLLLGMLFRRN